MEEYCLTNVPVLIPVVRGPNEVLVLDINEMLCRTNGLYICCMYAHIDKDVLPANQVLFNTTILLHKIIHMHQSI